MSECLEDHQVIYFIDTSTPQTLERDFYAWLNADYPYNVPYASSHVYINHSEKSYYNGGGSSSYTSTSNGSSEEAMSERSSPNMSASPQSSMGEGNECGGYYRSGMLPGPDMGMVNSYGMANLEEMQRPPLMNCPNGQNTLVDSHGQLYQQQVGGISPVVQAATGQGRSSGTNQLGRTYSPGLPLSMTEREQIVALYQNGWKICDISKKLCVTHSCVSKILNRFRMTGSVRPKDAKEGRVESPLVIAIRDYRFRLGMTRQSEIREQLIADGVCSRENAPSRSSINHILRTKLDIKKRTKPV
uniref:Paired domain-containing protein n=1 Tax=Rhabditophanes sp. KR3021 TaxID=114890 RepID=A0AC35TY62_9BILA